MKKKITAFLVAALMLIGSVSALAAQTNKAILLCYNDGKLVYSTLLTIGEHKEIPEEFEAADKADRKADFNAHSFYLTERKQPV